MSSGDHPEMDGQTERVNHTLEDILSSYVSLRQHTWNKWLPLLEFAYNDRKHSSTGMSPFELNYDYRLANLTTVGVSHKVPSAMDYVVKMRKMLTLAKDNIRQAMDRSKSYADVNRSFREFEEGEKVFLKVPSHSKSLISRECKVITSILCAVANSKKNKQSCL